MSCVVQIQTEGKAISKLEVGFVELRDDLQDMKRILGELHARSAEMTAPGKSTRDQGTFTDHAQKVSRRQSVACESETQHVRLQSLIECTHLLCKAEFLLPPVPPEIYLVSPGATSNPSPQDLCHVKEGKISRTTLAF